MSTKVKNVLLLFFVFLFITLSIYQSNKKEQVIQKEQEDKIENEIVEETEEIKEEVVEENKEDSIKQEIKEEKKEPIKKPTVEKPVVEKPIVEEQPTENTVVDSSGLVSLGKFKLTAYCPCSKCCGKWAGGNTASGTKPTANRTIAVDTKVIPFGTEVTINGVTYIAEDTGSSINGNRIDVYMESHQAALNFGIQYAEVFIKK